MITLLTSLNVLTYGSIQLLNTWLIISSSQEILSEIPLIVLFSFIKNISCNFGLISTGISNGICTIFSKYSDPSILCTSSKALHTTFLSIDKTYIILGKLPTCLTNWKISLICELVNRSISSIITIIFWLVSLSTFSNWFLVTSKSTSFDNSAPWALAIVFNKMANPDPTIGTNDNASRASE